MKKRIMSFLLGITLICMMFVPVLAYDNVGYCVVCKTEREFVPGCEYINELYHAVRHWCVECGYDQLAGGDIREHDTGCRYCEALPSPDNIRIIDGAGGVLVLFDPVETAESYILVVYRIGGYCHYFELSDTWMWLSAEEYSWVFNNDDSKIRVQAVTDYQASLFSDSVEIF
jgi:hypothetical protein